MRIAHVQRKYEPAEWSGIQTAFLRSLDSLRDCGVFSVVFCPRKNSVDGLDPIAMAGHPICYFQACLPIWGLAADSQRELMTPGSELFSFELYQALQRTPALDLIHIHTLGELGAISHKFARRHQIPCVATLSGGIADLHESRRIPLTRRPIWSFDWSRLFNIFLRPHHLLDRIDAIIVSNPAESGLLKERYPRKRIHLLPHGVALARYEADCRSQAETAFPQIKGRTVLLCPARIDPAKNQQWLLYQLPAILNAFPDVLIVMAGAYTDEHYGNTLQQRVEQMGLANAVLMTGLLPPDDPKLIGLFQHGKALVLPSLVETVGVAILEAWAAGMPVIANRTSVAAALIHHNEDGWLFDLAHPQTLHQGLHHVLSSHGVAAQFAAAGRRRVQAEFDSLQLAGKLKALYEELVDTRLISNHRSVSGYKRAYAT